MPVKGLWREERRIHSAADTTSAAHFNNIDQYMEDLGGHL